MDLFSVKSQSMAYALVKHWHSIDDVQIMVRSLGEGFQIYSAHGKQPIQLWTQINETFVAGWESCQMEHQKNPNPLPGLESLSSISQLLSIPETWVKTEADTGNLPHIKIDEATYLFDRSVVVAYVGKKLNTMPSVPSVDKIHAKIRKIVFDVLREPEIVKFLGAAITVSKRRSKK